MSAIQGPGEGNALESRVGRGTSSQSAIEHRIAARRGHVPTRAELQREAREHGVKYWYRMPVVKLEELRSRGWEVTDEDLADYATGSGTTGEGQWAPQNQ